MERKRVSKESSALLSLESAELTHEVPISSLEFLVAGAGSGNTAVYVRLPAWDGYFSLILLDGVEELFSLAQFLDLLVQLCILLSEFLYCFPFLCCLFFELLSCCLCSLLHLQEL